MFKKQKQEKKWKKQTNMFKPKRKQTWVDE